MQGECNYKLRTKKLWKRKMNFKLKFLFWIVLFKDYWRVLFKLANGLISYLYNYLLCINICCVYNRTVLTYTSVLRSEQPEPHSQLGSTVQNQTRRHHTLIKKNNSAEFRVLIYSIKPRQSNSLISPVI